MKAGCDHLRVDIRAIVRAWGSDHPIAVDRRNLPKLL